MLVSELLIAAIVDSHGLIDSEVWQREGLA